jgi:NAD(P)H-dependent nitrite reductase small subunit
VARVGDVAPGAAIPVVVGDREIALFNIDDAFYAVDNACPHQGGPLCEGWVEDKSVTCPWHSWTFDLQTGKMPLDDISILDVFDVRVEAGDIMVGRTPRPAS